MYKVYPVVASQAGSVAMYIYLPTVCAGFENDQNGQFPLLAVVDYCRFKLSQISKTRTILVVILKNFPDIKPPDLHWGKGTTPPAPTPTWCPFYTWPTQTESLDPPMQS